MSKLKAKEPADVQPGHTKAMIFGASGVGKTWFTLAFPRPYYIDTEGGADLKHYQERLMAAGGAYLGPQDGALDFATVLEQLQALATEKHGFKTLIIDSVTKLFQTSIANEAARLGDKDAFGVSKKPAVAGMRQLVNWTQRLDMNVWFVAHDVAEWGIDPTTKQRTEIGRAADTWDKLIFELDLTLHAQKRGSSRVAVVKKSRLLGFPDLESFPLEYKEFSDRYGKDFIEAEAKQIILATPEQVTEIERIIKLISLPQEKVDAALNKAKAASFAELSTEQAVNYINYLKKQIQG